MESGTNKETASTRKTAGNVNSKAGGEDVPCLVGSIVERGVQPAAPFVPNPADGPTALAFPVARHRSHEPRWCLAADTGTCRVRDEDGENDATVEHMQFDHVAPLANPIDRKEKKNMDFSSWREIMNVGQVTKLESINAGDMTDPEVSVNEGYVYHHRSVKLDDVQDAYCYTYREGHTDFMRTQTRKISDEQEIDSAEAIKVHEKSMFPKFTCDGSTPTLEAQIDAENRELVAKMSPEEIAEAKAEIMEKINPVLLRALQNRGREKKKKQAFNASSLDLMPMPDSKPVLRSTTGNEPEDSPAKSVAPSVISVTPNSPQASPVSGSEGSRSTNDFLWNSWSKRVERVRELRFTLDGSVIRQDEKWEFQTDNSSTYAGYDANNVAERDLLRTEGDPGAVGYTIKEAIMLTRSLIPGQRALALNLLTVLLDKALSSISINRDGGFQDTVISNQYIDWEAVWAFALGPEPELVLSLRLCIDDNHTSVVLACVKALVCALGCGLNENYFNIYEKIPTSENDICTSPVFRCKPKMEEDFFGGGFWKYSAKPSTICPEGRQSDNEEEEEDKDRTIRDDLVVSGQDTIAGLLRMGVLPRIRYLLEMDPNFVLAEFLMLILIAVARHSPTAARAVMECERLTESVVERFSVMRRGGSDAWIYMSRVVVFLKVTAKRARENCVKLVDDGSFHEVTWHLSEHGASIDRWLASSKETRKWKVSLIVEQLRFWKVCIRYGLCLHRLREFSVSIHSWLLKSDGELLDVSREAYAVIASLVRHYPDLISTGNPEQFCLDDVHPLVHSSIHWLTLPLPLPTSVTWVIAAVAHMIFCVLDRAIMVILPENAVSLLPWLPELAAAVDRDMPPLSTHDDGESSIASTCCLRALLRVRRSLKSIHHVSDCGRNLLPELVSSVRQHARSIETFGRGGPAPGPGFGWGASGGGFWSLRALFAQSAASLIIDLLAEFEPPNTLQISLNVMLMSLPGSSLAGEALDCILRCEEPGQTLSSHYTDRWLLAKKPHDAPIAEWARQRLPLPPYWYLSPMTSGDPAVVESGLLFILAVEKLPVPPPVPLVWKLHALSALLLHAFGLLEDSKRCRDAYESLQALCGKALPRCGSLEFLEVHELYPAFVDRLVEQFAAVSYGAVFFGRQLAVYLLRSVDAPVRARAWNALSEARVLHLIPPLRDLIGGDRAYLEPNECDVDVMQAYAGSWASGSLDRAASRRASAFSFALHHLSFYLFGPSDGDQRVSVRRKIVRLLLRDWPRRRHMMADLVVYEADAGDVPKRLEVLVDACCGVSSLLHKVDQLRSSVMSDSSGSCNSG